MDSWSDEAVRGGKDSVGSEPSISTPEASVVGKSSCSACEVGDGGSSATSLNPSRYMEIASSTLMPWSISHGASGVSGERSVIELPLVMTLLRSVPDCCSVLDREVTVELKLVRSASVSAGPWVGNRGKGRPRAPESCLRSGDMRGRGRLFGSREVDMEIRRPPLLDGALR